MGRQSPIGSEADPWGSKVMRSPHDRQWSGASRATMSRANAFRSSDTERFLSPKSFIITALFEFTGIARGGCSWYFRVHIKHLRASSDAVATSTNGAIWRRQTLTVR